jgi:polyketide synthase PksN
MQTRRDHFDERAVFMASDRAELLALLDAGAPPPPDEGEAQGALAARYLHGEAVDWESVWPTPLRRLSLPTYPFLRTRHWFSANDSVYATAGADAVPRLEPTGPGRGLLTTFTGDEFYLRDHLVEGRKVLPGVVHLEVAVQAAREAGIDASAIDDVVWLRSFDVNGVPSGIEVQLGPAEPDVEFALVAPGDPKAVYASGTLRHGTRPPVSPRTDLVALERSCPREVDPADLYRRLSAAGLRHGPALATVRALRMGLNDALGRVSLPEAAAALHAYMLHPALLDGALQILAAFDEDDDRLYMPFSVDRVVRTAPLTAACAVHVARRPGTTDGLRSFDVRLLDDAGDELVALVNLTTRRAGATAAPPPEDSRERLRALLRGVRDGVVADDQATTAIGAILDD